MDRILLALSLIVLTVSLKVDRSRMPPNVDPNFLDMLRREKRHKEFAFYMGIDDPSKVIPREGDPEDASSDRALCTASFGNRDPEEARQATKFSKYPGRRWPKAPGKSYSVVPYNIESGIKGKQYLKVTNTLKKIWNVLVPWVQWVPHSDQNDYVYIYSGDECFAELGRRGSRQNMMLNKECIMSEVAILHEAMHTVGMDHEHSRLDRDNYIKILWENLDKNWSWVYNKHSPEDYDDVGNYDYYTFMHYYKTAFTYGQNHSFIVLKEGVDVNDVGRSENLTKEDINKLRIMYDV